MELDATKGNTSNPYSNWNKVPLEVERLSDQFTKTMDVIGLDIIPIETVLLLDLEKFVTFYSRQI